MGLVMVGNLGSVKVLELRRSRARPAAGARQAADATAPAACCRQSARLAAVEDGFNDVRGEIAEGDEPGEIGRAHTLALGQCGKRHAVAADECRVEPARPGQQLDEPRIAFGCRKRVGAVRSAAVFAPTGSWARPPARRVPAPRQRGAARPGSAGNGSRSDPIRTSMHSNRAAGQACWRGPGNSGQLFPISAAHAIG